MPNLQPDTSIYANIGKQQGGFGSLSLPALVGLATKVKEFQGRQGLTGALSNPANMMPGSSGVIDPQAVQQEYSTGGGFVDPEHVRQIWALAHQQAELRQQQLTSADGMVSSLLTAPGSKRGELWAKLAPQLRKWGVPGDLVAQAGEDLSSDSLAAMHNWIHDNSPLPTVPTVEPRTGKPLQIPGGAIKYGAEGGPGVAGPPGAYATGIAPQEAIEREAAAKVSTELRESGPRISQNRSMLSTLDSLSEGAPEGGGADFAVRWSRWMHELGLPDLATLKPEQVAKGENYTKIANRLVAQMQEGGGAHTNAWLNNYQGGNPSLVLSRLGRAGVTHWLQGTNDVENLIASRWDAYLGTHPGEQGQYLNWLNSKSGMDAKMLDPRVFQFQRMTDAEQKEFTKMMKPGEKGAFLRRLQQYERRGWLRDAKGADY